jgi:hypothetical protein
MCTHAFHRAQELAKRRLVWKLAFAVGQIGEIGMAVSDFFSALIWTSLGFLLCVLLAGESCCALTYSCTYTHTLVIKFASGLVQDSFNTDLCFVHCLRTQASKCKHHWNLSSAMGKYEGSAGAVSV